MPETAVESKICDICGAEIRGGSLFCYNCGGSVSKAQAEDKGDDPVALSNGGQLVESAVSLEKRRGRRQRAVNREPAEVVWEPRAGVSVAFVVGSLVFILIAICLFLAASYLN